MARLNNDARGILCDMVDQKAEDTRKKLAETLTIINREIDASYKERVKAARKEIELMIPTINTGIDRILKKHKLEWKTNMYNDSVYTFENIFMNGNLKNDIYLYDYFSDEEKKPNRKLLVEAQLKDLDARVAKAKQEILLRAALGMKYNEVVAIVNGFMF